MYANPKSIHPSVQNSPFPSESLLSYLLPNQVQELYFLSMVQDDLVVYLHRLRRIANLRQRRL